MMATGAMLKSLYPELFHVTCFAYLLNNCAIETKSHSANALIEKVILAAVKNET